jgi:hypothetical protein
VQHDDARLEELREVRGEARERRAALEKNEACRAQRTEPPVRHDREVFVLLDADALQPHARASGRGGRGGRAAASAPPARRCHLFARRERDRARKILLTLRIICSEESFGRVDVRETCTVIWKVAGAF